MSGCAFAMPGAAWARSGLLFAVLLYGVAASGCRTPQPGPGRARVDFPTLPVPAVEQQKKATCGAAALSAVARYWGVAADEPGMIRELGPPPRRGYSLAQLRDWARAHGLSAFVVEGDAAFLREHLRKGRPLIVPLQRSATANHIVVVTGVSPKEDYFALMDPESGAQRLVTRGYLERRRSPLRDPVLVVARASTGGAASREDVLGESTPQTRGNP